MFLLVTLLRKHYSNLHQNHSPSYNHVIIVMMFLRVTLLRKHYSNLHQNHSPSYNHAIIVMT